ncbi:MAG: MerR family transcriptional regulator [Patescibacteria group bacterium]
MENFISAGKLAKLANTTKRTIQFYDQKEILKPAIVAHNGYRYYRENQVLEYQMILLLTTLGITLKEIKQYLSEQGDLTSLFNNKKQPIQYQIRQLQFNLNSIENFIENLKKNGTMVNPLIKQMKPFGVYFIEKTGPYSKIDIYCKELIKMFSNKANELTTLAIFEEQEYKPLKSKIKIGVLAKRGVVIKQEHKKEIKHMVFKPGKVITYMHNGSSKLLSLFWKELEKYCQLHKIKVRTDVPDFEIYHQVSPDPSKQFFEIFLPIK